MPRILEVDEQEPRPMDTDGYDDDGGSAWRAGKGVNNLISIATREESHRKYCVNYYHNCTRRATMLVVLQ